MDSVVGPEKATIDDLFDLVVADVKLRKLRDVAHIEWRYAANIKPLLGSLLTSWFTTAQALHYIEKRQQAGASNAAINRELSIVRRGFKLALRKIRRWCTGNRRSPASKRTTLGRALSSDRSTKCCLASFQRASGHSLSVDTTQARAKGSTTKD